MNHTSLLNYLADKIKAKSYLEIGVQTTQQNFDKIKVPIKVGVDPAVDDPKVLKMTSDNFFTYVAGIQGKNGTTTTYDLIFLDGLHTKEQIQKDFENAFELLTDDGFIVIHDTLPDEEQCTKVPRETKKWFGDVYKFAMVLGKYRDAIDFRTINIDCGCTVVWKGKAEMRGIDRNVSWDVYLSDRQENMRIIEASEIDNYIKSNVVI